jgi:hypothetical protein
MLAAVTMHDQPSVPCGLCVCPGAATASDEGAQASSSSARIIEDASGSGSRSQQQQRRSWPWSKQPARVPRPATPQAPQAKTVMFEQPAGEYKAEMLHITLRPPYARCLCMLTCACSQTQRSARRCLQLHAVPQARWPWQQAVHLVLNEHAMPYHAMPCHAQAMLCYAAAGCR